MTIIRLARQTTTFASILALTGASACVTSQASAATPQDAIGSAVEKPFRDLNLIRDQLPEPVLKAAEAPYDRTGFENCETITSEISALDAALGADVDQEAEGGDGDIISAALSSVISIPFSGVVRYISGAKRREVAKRRATVAAFVRRGYLKGVAVEQGCPIPPPPAPADA